MPDREPACSGDWRDMTRVNGRRSFAFLGCGALAGLLIAGYALFTARGTSTLVVPAEDVALVNQQPISRSDFLLQLQTLYSVDLAHSTLEQRRRVMDDLIREEIFVQRGKELDLAATDPDVRSATVAAVELQIAADAIASQPGEAELLSFYRTHLTRYASEGVMTVRDFILSAGEASAGILDCLESRRQARALVDECHVRDSGRIGPEEFYFAVRLHLGERLFDVARALPDGGISAPISLADGIHVLYMERNAVPRPYDFAAARDRVLKDYRAEAVERLRAGDEKFLRKRANVLIADDVNR